MSTLNTLGCFLPDFIKDDITKAPSCYLSTTGEVSQDAIIQIDPETNPNIEWFSCDSLYHFEPADSACVPNICYCANGHPTTNCTAHNNHDCDSCDVGFTTNVFLGATTCVLDVYDNYWQKQTVCRCETLLKYGFDCEKKLCSYVYDVESIVNMDLEAKKMSVSDYALQRTKEETAHIETESFEDIENCEDWSRCLASLSDVYLNDDYYPNLISRLFQYTQELDSQFILAKDLLNYQFIEYLEIMTTHLPRKKLPSHLLYNAKNLKILSMSYFSNRNLNISKFIMTNMKLEAITLAACDLEIIEENDFNGINLKSLIIFQSELKTISTKIFQYQTSLVHLMLTNNKLENISYKTFQNLKQLQKLNLGENTGTVYAETGEERDESACGCGFILGCFLPDFITDILS